MPSTDSRPAGARPFSPPMRRTIVLALGLVASAACSGTPERPTTLLFEQGGDFWSLPFPSDLRKQADGSYGYRAWPNAAHNEMVNMWLTTADDRLKDGFGLSSGVFIKASGPIDPTTLPASPEASLAKDA